MSSGGRLRLAPQIESGDRQDVTRMQESQSSSRILTRRVNTEISCPDVIGVVFLADGEHFVSGDSHGRIRRWQVQDGTEVGTPMNAASVVWSIAVSQDGKWIVSGTDNGQVMVWNAKSHEKVKVIKGHTDRVHTVDMSPDSTRIASGSNDKTVGVWSLSGSRLLGPLKHDESVVAVKFSPDGRLIATATWLTNSVRIYDDGHLLVDVPVKVSAYNNQTLAWWSDKQLFALSYEGNIYCIDVSSHTTLSQWPVHDPNYHSCLSLANNGAFIATSSNSSVSFWDTTTHKQLGSLIHYSGSVSSMGIWANHDLLIAGGSKIVLRDPLDILPSPYLDETFEIQPIRAEARVKEAIESCARSGLSINTLIPILEKNTQELRILFPDAESMVKQKEDGMNEVIRSLSAENANSNEKIANLEKTVQDLHDKLTQSQNKVDAQQTAETLLRAYRRKHHCETLYANGHVIDVAQILLEMDGTASDDTRADTWVMDWLFEVTNRCISQLEKIGDEASRINNHDEALAAYSTALSLGPSTPGDLLIKWATISLLRGTTNDALDIAIKFKVPRFLVYCAMCDILEGGNHIPDAIGCFRQMQSELASDTSIQDERALWELGFQRRCAQKLQQLFDVAMDSRNYKEAVDHLTTILSFSPTDRVDIIIKRSKARVMMSSWEDALADADEVIQLDPSSYRGYEQRLAVLHGAGRYAEAVQALDTMFLKLDQSPEGRELRGRYVDARPDIRRIINATVSHMPRVLIDTTAGQLLDRTQLAGQFEAHQIFFELVSSMTTGLDYARVLGEVKKFYRYAMFSHKWGDGEPLLQDVEHISIYELKPSPANVKLQTFCSIARSHGCRWAWSDTCCIDKANNVVLQESLVAMFNWYRGSALTIIHLLGVSSNSNKVDLKDSIWNTRAWTYQEYMAAERVLFYTEDWQSYLGLTLSNHKESPIVVSKMQVSPVSQKQLAVLRPGLNRVREKLFLASTRQSTFVEDMAYSLLGIFNVTIPVIYGEGNRAVGRLLEHILTGSRDVTILAWTGTANTYNSCLPMDLTVYNQLEPPHIPSPVEIDQIVTELGSSVPDLSLVMKLYDLVNALPPPFLASSRLELPGIIVPVNKVARESDPDPRTDMCVYRATTIVFGDVAIQTTNDLTAMDDLCLVHPWIRPLLDQEFSRGPGKAARHDKTKRALRLVARLMQPFGALLFEQVSRVEYRRVATDSLIMAQVCKDVSLDDLIENIDKIEVQ